jgi:hypothetical protein
MALNGRVGLLFLHVFIWEKSSEIVTDGQSHKISVKSKFQDMVQIQIYENT